MTQMTTVCVMLVVLFGAVIALPEDAKNSGKSASAQRRVTFGAGRDSDIIVGDNSERRTFVTTPEPSRVRTSPVVRVTQDNRGNNEELIIGRDAQFGISDRLIPGTAVPFGGSSLGLGGLGGLGGVGSLGTLGGLGGLGTLGGIGGLGTLGGVGSLGLGGVGSLGLGGVGNLGLGGVGGLGLGGVLGGIDPGYLELLVARNPLILVQNPEILLQYPHLILRYPQLLVQYPQILLQYPQLLIQYPQLRQYIDSRYLDPRFSGVNLGNFRRVFPTNFVGGVDGFDRFGGINNIDGLTGIGGIGINSLGVRPGLDFNQPIDVGFNRPILTTISPFSVTTLSPFNRNIRFEQK
ncbi:uncharacterized protein LOC125178271 [Hyalella azteca]|uniref:Uncharacterized protein LOC125178271 n=1 Tax=Hyalella azteca TaxID=294128 RepID=A0A979FKT0_HYAAZ|nr:uncharacterized protein LOC125178271 [Hyalella azteca]